MRGENGNLTVACKIKTSLMGEKCLALNCSRLHLQAILHTICVILGPWIRYFSYSTRTTNILYQ